MEHNKNLSKTAKRFAAAAVSLIIAIGASAPGFSRDHAETAVITAAADEAPAPSYGEGTFEADGCVYNYDCIEYHEGFTREAVPSVTLKSVETENTVINIPSQFTVNGYTYTVETLGYNFGNGLKAVSVTVPETIKTIENDVFANSDINELTIKSTVLRVINDSFCANSRIGTLDMASSPELKSVGRYFFDNSSYLSQATNGDSVIIANILVKYTGSEANVKISDLGEGITVLGTDAMSDLSNLETVDLTGVKGISWGAFYCSGNLESLINGNDVEYAGPYSFSGTKFENVVAVSDEYILGHIILKYTVKDNTLDLTNVKFRNIKSFYPFALPTDEIYTVKCNSANSTPLWDPDVPSHAFHKMETLIFNGEEIKCSDRHDILPRFLDDHYGFIRDSVFEDNWVRTMAKSIIEDLGLKYYGPENSEVHDNIELTPRDQFYIILKIHDYIGTHYRYDNSTQHFAQMLTCDRNMVCQGYAELTAYLLECSGVDAEVVYALLYEDNDPTKKELWSGCHAWNVVRIGDKWFQLDTCWDSVDFSYGYNCTNSWFLCSDDRLRQEEIHSHWVEALFDDTSYWFYNDYPKGELLPFTCDTLLADANGDGYRDVTDGDALTNYLAYHKEFDDDGNKLIYLENCDINFDGEIDIADAVLTYRICNGQMIDPFPDEARPEPMPEPPYTGEDDVEYVLGDVSGNGKIDVTDLSKIAAHIKSKKMLDENAVKLADVNGNGKVDVTDLSKIAAHVKGKKLLS